MKAVPHLLPVVAPAIAAFLLLASSVAARAQDIPVPDLWDTGTGEQIPGSEVLQTKDFGAVVAGLPPKGGFFKTLARKKARKNLQQEGFQSGDIILSVDGLRTYGWREFEIARFRNSLSSDMTLLVNRNGDLQWITLHKLAPGRKIGTETDPSMEADRFVKEIEKCGVDVADDKVRAQLYLLPPRAAAEMARWSATLKSPGPDDIAWVREFIDLYSALQQRKYADAKAPAHQPPIPYFQRLEKFYLGLAAANQPREVAPSVAQSGETPEFYVLALPIPDYKAPLGDLNLSDARFKLLLDRSYARGSITSDGSGIQADADLATATEAYANSKADDLGVRLLDRVRAAALDPSKYDSLPFDNDIVMNSVSVNLLMQQFGGKLTDEKAADWPLYAVAMISLNLHAHEAGEAARILGELAKVSPFLARTAGQGAAMTRPFLYPNVKVVNGMLQSFRGHDGFLGPDVPAVYKWALSNVGPGALTWQEVAFKPPAGPFTLLTRAPYAELVVLKGLPAKPAPAPAPAPIIAPAASPAPSPAASGTAANNPI